MAAGNKQLCRLWVIRHGQTEWNAIGRIQGQTRTELNEEGRREARVVGRALRGMGWGGGRFSACYASDLPRAVETARIILGELGGQMEVKEVVGLRERSFGKLEGAMSGEVRAMRVAAGLPDSHDLADWTGMPGVEENAAVYERAAGALKEIAGEHAREDVLVVTHGGVMGRLLYKCLGIPDGVPRRFPLSNGICAVLELRGEEFYLVTLADLGLLSGEGVTVDTAMGGVR